MRRGIALFMHVNSVAISQPETELPLYCGFRILEQEGAKLDVIRGSREEAFRRGGGFLH